MTKKPKIIEDMYDLRMKIFFEFENECFCLILEMFKKILELQKKCIEYITGIIYNSNGIF